MGGSLNNRHFHHKRQKRTFYSFLSLPLWLLLISSSFLLASLIFLIFILFRYYLIFFIFLAYFLLVSWVPSLLGFVVLVIICSVLFFLFSFLSGYCNIQMSFLVSPWLLSFVVTPPVTSNVNYYGWVSKVLWSEDDLCLNCLSGFIFSPFSLIISYF